MYATNRDRISVLVAPSSGDCGSSSSRIRLLLAASKLTSVDSLALSDEEEEEAEVNVGNGEGKKNNKKMNN